MRKESLFQRVLNLWQYDENKKPSDLDLAFVLGYLARREKYQYYIECGVKSSLPRLIAGQMLYSKRRKVISIREGCGNHEQTDGAVTIEKIDKAPMDAFHSIKSETVYRIVPLSRKEKAEIEREVPKKGSHKLLKKHKLCLLPFETDVLHLGEEIKEDDIAKTLCLYETLLSQKGILILSGHNLNKLKGIYSDLNDRYILLFEHQEFAIFLKDDALVEENLYAAQNKYVPVSGANSRHLQKMLPCILDNLHQQLQTEQEGKNPSIFVGIMTYNSSAYIQECLYSIFEQQGNFTVEIGIFDDASTDDTVEKIEGMQGIPPHVSLTIYKNKKNGGFSQNYIRVFNQFEMSGCDYFACIDGDDYLVNSSRFQKHLDELARHPECALSFNRLLLYHQKQQEFITWDIQNKLHKQVYTAFDLANEYFIGNGSASLIRRNAVQDINNDYFYKANAGDWIMHLVYSMHGDILYINECMNVYRKHSGGVWSNVEDCKRLKYMLTSLREFNKLTEYLYYNELFYGMAKLLNYPNTPLLRADLLIGDDVFPHTSSGFRIAEFNAYLKHFENMSILCSGDSTHLLGKKTHPEIMAEYKQRHPEVADKLYETNTYAKGGKVFSSRARLAYFCFLGNTWCYLDWLEKNRIPFVFELYPGGEFAINNALSDIKLRRVLESPCFRKVIVTQDITRDYLLDNKFCDKEDIVEIFGVVTPNKLLSLPLPQKKIEASTPLNLCFAAMRYTPDGSDKGYDVLLETVRKLILQGIPIHLHVAGGFDENVLPVDDIKEYITFHGVLKNQALHDFFHKMDIILSPNKPGQINKGGFDGFPTGTCTEAGLCGVLIMCSDPLSLNNGRFIPGEEIEILLNDADAYADRIAYYYHNREAMEKMVAKQYDKIQYLYSQKAQIGGRIAVLEAEIAQYQNNLRRIVHNISEKNEHSGQYTGVLFYANSLASFVYQKHILFTYYIAKNGQYIASIDLSRLSGKSVYLRLDFVNNKLVNSCFSKIEINDEPVKIFTSNGVNVEGCYLFNTKKPLIVFEKTMIPKDDIVMMTVRGELTFPEQKDNQKRYERTKLASLYYHGHNEIYAAEKVIHSGYEWGSDGSVEVSFSLESIPLDQEWLRFDILEGEYCSFVFDSICLGNKPLQIARTNSEDINGRHYFHTIDPIVELEPYSRKEGSDVLTIKGHLEILRESELVSAGRSLQTARVGITNKTSASFLESGLIEYEMTGEQIQLRLPLEQYALEDGKPFYVALQFIQDTFCRMEIEEIECGGAALPYKTNGKTIGDTTIFLTKEPTLWIRKKLSLQTSDEYITIRGKIHGLTAPELEELIVAKKIKIR